MLMILTFLFLGKNKAGDISDISICQRVFPNLRVFAVIG
ncbi:hypothetical protein C943_00469 [Mariniradius saccharolyticus AK6]|uniref:Uncharacterized protein n=1 Tax=Mariniradius saccharolyticus AK6 TaxID=1239962 RepID=M7XXG3_9BACT|nr:hypothetical protein C943_00469 [Mariniradius saccharolyticus AK6]